MQNIIPYKHTSLTSYQVRIQCSPCHSQAEEPPSQKRWGEGSLTLRWGELPQGPRRIRSHHGLPHSALGLLLCRCLERKKYIMDRQIKNVKKCIICIINCNWKLYANNYSQRGKSKQFRVYWIEIIINSNNTSYMFYYSF